MREPDIRCGWGTMDRCGEPAVVVVHFETYDRRVRCQAHADALAFYKPDRIEPLCRDPRPVAILCGAIAGAIPPDTRDVIADYIAHDRLGQADPSPLLDLAEQRGLHEGGYGPERYEEWPEAMEHVHVWLLAIGEGNGGQRGPMRVGPGGPLVRRCPCGVLEHEARDNSDRGRITAIQIGETRNLVWVDPFNGI